VDHGDDDSGEDGENDEGGGDAVGQEGDGVVLAGSCAGRARVAEPDGGGESIGRRGQPGLAAEFPTGASARGTASASGGAVGDGQITPATGGPRRGQHVGVDAAAPPRPARGRQVGPLVLLNAANALAKIGNTLNLLWRDAKCSCFEWWRRDDYNSAGSYAPARAVFNQRKREKVLEDHAAGFSKAVGRRDPSVTEEQREEVSRRLLLTPTSPAAYQLKSVLAGLFVFTFSLDARGGTARGVAWSDLAVRQFPAIFSEVGGPIDVLCTYITASKTSEGIVHNIGALGHVSAWLCPAVAMADAMVATFHAPGMDESRPPQGFQLIFQPTDAELRASGLDPTRYWAADQPYGFRAWYRVPLWPSARGNTFAQINAAYHQKKQREVLLQCGVSRTAAKTHLGRQAAAQKGKEAGVSENDIKKQGFWNQGVARGAYDAAIPNQDAIVALPSRPLSTTSPTTPRYKVPVPLALQATMLLAKKKRRCRSPYIAVLHFSYAPRARWSEHPGGANRSRNEAVGFWLWSAHHSGRVQENEALRHRLLSNGTKTKPGTLVGPFCTRRTRSHCHQSMLVCGVSTTVPNRSKSRIMLAKKKRRCRSPYIAVLHFSYAPRAPWSEHPGGANRTQNVAMGFWLWSAHHGGRVQENEALRHRLLSNGTKEKPGTLVGPVCTRHKRAHGHQSMLVCGVSTPVPNRSKSRIMLAKKKRRCRSPYIAVLHFSYAPRAPWSEHPVGAKRTQNGAVVLVLWSAPHVGFCSKRGTQALLSLFSIFITNQEGYSR